METNRDIPWQTKKMTSSDQNSNCVRQVESHAHKIAMRWPIVISKMLWCLCSFVFGLTIFETHTKIPNFERQLCLDWWQKSCNDHTVRALNVNDK